jgi:hypothetical protein
MDSKQPQHLSSRVKAHFSAFLIGMVLVIAQDFYYHPETIPFRSPGNAPRGSLLVHPYAVLPFYEQPQHPALVIDLRSEHQKAVDL